MMSRRQTAFTLIELLVVIAIIAILAAILFPVFAQAREKGRQAACISNLRQLSQATLMYAQDYDETFPGVLMDYDVGEGFRTTFIETLMPYVRNRSIGQCPSAVQHGYCWPTTSNPCARYLPWDYSLNFSLSFRSYRTRFYNDTLFRTLSEVTQPAQNFLMTDNDGGWRLYTFWRNLDCEVTGKCLPGIESLNEVPIYQRHLRGVTVAFIDGHAKWVRSPQGLLSVEVGGTMHYSPYHRAP